MHNRVDWEQSKNTGLYGSKNQPCTKSEPQLGGEFVVQRTPKLQDVVRDKEGVNKHSEPGPGDRPQFPKGVEQHVKLQNQPESGPKKITKRQQRS